MRHQKTIVLLFTFVLIICSFAGCSSTGVLSEEDSNNIRIKPPEDACEGELFYPNPDDYMLTDLRMVNSVGSIPASSGVQAFYGISSLDATWDPPVAGRNIYVNCSVEEDDFDEAMNLKIYMFEHNDNYSWNLEDAVLVIETESHIGSPNYITFYHELPQDIEAGLYTFIVMNDEMKIDSVFEYEIVDSDEDSECLYMEVDKPVIYLYPETDTECYVSLDLQGYLTCTYPSYNEDYGWHVMAHPDGTITNIENDREYDYLFWEGECDVPDSFNNAVCVRGCDTAQFLEDYLEACGLTYSEMDDFISFWLPRMECNEYNIISFPAEEYEEMASLNVSPVPDTVIRVYMVFMPLNEEVQIPEEQQLVWPSSVERTGFTVVEWGGSEL